MWVGGRRRAVVASQRRKKEEEESRVVLGVGEEFAPGTGSCN
jgi:hypothetical protein